MVLARFSWRHGGRLVFVCGSFSRWVEHYPMAPVDRSPTPVFEATCDLPPGIHQFRFLVDGVWRIDEQLPCLSDEYGMVNNAILIEEPNVSSSMASSSNHLPAEQVAWISDTDLRVSRLWVSRLLSNQTIYGILPRSSKLSIIDAQLPVKHAFRIMYEEGLLVVPLWDDSSSSITGMITASDFILILKELQNSLQPVANEELERHSVSAWKENKLQLYTNSNGSVGAMARPLIHLNDIMALARDDAYAHINLDQITLEQALEQVNQTNLQNNGRRQFHTCVRSTPLREIMERLSDPGVRRLIVIDARSRRVEGIISVRDVFTFLLGPPHHPL